MAVPTVGIYMPVYDTLRARLEGATAGRPPTPPGRGGGLALPFLRPLRPSGARAHTPAGHQPGAHPPPAAVEWVVTPGGLGHTRGGGLSETLGGPA